MERRFVIGVVALTWLASLWRQGHAECTGPDPVSGTRHNGTNPTSMYETGTVLYFSCDTGYKLTYGNPTSVCLVNGNWNPSDLKCEIDIVSLVVAVIVAFVGIVVFVLAICWLLKRRKETDSRAIKRKGRDNTYAQYEPRRSANQNGQMNHGMTEIEMGNIGAPMMANGSVVSRTSTNGHANANGLLWSPPSARGSVKQETEFAVLQRTRKSSGTSRSSRTDNVTPNTKAGVQLNPDYGDIEFGAGNTNIQNFKDIGSTVTTMAQPTMGVNPMDMSLPMPDSSSPTMTTDENMSPPDTGRDYNDLYAAVDMSKKKKNRQSEEKKQNNNNNSMTNGVTVATIEDGGYSSVGSPPGSFSAHEEALAGESAYSSVTMGNDGVQDADGDYAVVKRVDDTVKDDSDDFDGLYAKVKK